ncbi:hypothetical protein VAR608DRAFT_0358 [Variovorax sp. HW608]|uniref:hypothetical protein n=1 Tax=Variovorax sp. HW608 TaxID=1034889 RepID=UPI00081FEB96|nr:hypothetical protein [Variovorax sp. HW608]SCK09599.1 hypothetical protein VAR608DRAFT_0358 [Variovorax sp. HW608]
MRRSSLPKSVRDYSNWRKFTPPVDEDERARFDRYANGVKHYLDDGTLQSAAEIAGCSPSRVRQLVERCTKIANDGLPYGWIALVAGVRLSEYTRATPLPEGHHAGRKGSAGSFSAFLKKHPDIHEAIDAYIARGAAVKGRSKLPLVFRVFRYFRRLCEQRIPADQYPNNSESRGRRSIERYVNAYKLRHPELIGPWHGEDAADVANLGTGQHSFNLANVPYSVVGIDAHELHCVGTVVVDGPGGPRAIPIERIWIYAVIDEGARAVLGYSVAVASEVSSGDLLRAVRRCTEKWVPRDIKIGGYSYSPGAGLPYGTIPGLGPCRPACVKLDNALAHYAKIIQSDMRRSLGCAVTWGAVGKWWRNAVTERMFRTLEERGFQRLPSSTGSNTQDPHRGKFVEEATKGPIEFSELVDMVDVLFAELNAQNHSGLGGISPLKVLSNHARSPYHVIQRPPPPPSAFTPKLGVVVERVCIRGSYPNGRRPYFELDEQKYTSPELADEFRLIKKYAYAHVDQDDMRQIELYTEQGQSLGTAVPQSPYWRTTPHSRDLRKQINRCVRRGEIENASGVDLIDEYMAFCARKAYSGNDPKNPKISRAATAAAAAANETGRPVRARRRTTQLDLEEPPPQPRMPPHIGSTDWNRY